MGRSTKQLKRPEVLSIITINEGVKPNHKSNTDTGLEGVTYFDEPVDRKKHAEEQSRQR